MQNFPKLEKLESADAFRGEASAEGPLPKIQSNNVLEHHVAEMHSSGSVSRPEEQEAGADQEDWSFYVETAAVVGVVVLGVFIGYQLAKSTGSGMAAASGDVAQAVAPPVLPRF